MLVTDERPVARHSGFHGLLSSCLVLSESKPKQQSYCHTSLLSEPESHRRLFRPPPSILCNAFVATTTLSIVLLCCLQRVSRSTVAYTDSIQRNKSSCFRVRFDIRKIMFEPWAFRGLLASHVCSTIVSPAYVSTTVYVSRVRVRSGRFFPRCFTVKKTV